MATPSTPDRAAIPPEVLIFFRDIKEHPDDDTPRLIFADWLQEHGDAAAAARGEFLRLRVLRQRLSPDDPSYDLLKRREGELFTEHRWTWLGPLRDAARTWTFERGMVQITAQTEKLILPEVTAWAGTGAALWIDALTLTQATQRHIVQLAYSPLLAHLNSLDLSDNGHQTGLRVLFRTLREVCLPFLTRLLLARNRLTADHIASLAQCPYLPRLSYLDLQYNRLYDTAAHLLCDSPHLKNLTMLRLRYNRFTTEGVALLRQTFGDRVSF